MAPGIVVTFAGYLRDLPAGCPGEAAYVLGRYQAEDWGWLRSANGVFAFAVVDEARHRCVLGTDRFGVRPLFLSQSRRGVAFGVDLAPLIAWLGCPADMDHEVLQEIIAVGFPLSDRTPVRGIERVPPGTRVELSRAGSRVTRYWSVEDLPAIRAQPLEPFLDESRERLREVLRRLLARCAVGPVCTLSSGYDSRRLVLEGSELGARFSTVTAIVRRMPPGLSGSLEPPVIRELCQRIGATHRLVMPPGHPEGMALRSARMVRDALLDFQVPGPHHLWAVPLVAALPIEPGARNFDGLAGDTLLQNPFYALPRDLWGQWRLTDAVTDAIAPGHRRLDRLWAQHVSGSLDSRIRRALTSLPEGPYRLSHFYFLGRTRRMIALSTFGLMDLRLESFCPYMDTDLVEHAVTMDPELKGTLGLQGLALRRDLPAFADIPSSHTSAQDVPARYVADVDVPDPDFSGGFTVPELGRLVRAARRYGGIGAHGKYLASALLHAAGLGRLSPRWREPRIRELLQLGAAAATLGCASVTGLIRARDAAWSVLEGDQAP